MRLVRAALRRGHMVSLYPGDDLSQPYIKDSVDDSVVSEVHFAERVTVVVRGDHRVSGCTFLLVYGGDSMEAPIRSYTHNTMGEVLFAEAMGVRKHV